MSEFECFYKNNDLYFTGNINNLSSTKFVYLLRELESNLKSSIDKSITIYLNCYGGCVTSSLKMYEAIKRSLLDITIIAEGYVASGGTLLLCAATSKCSNYTTFMVHELRGSINHDLTGTKNVIDWWDKLETYCMECYKDTKLTSDMMLKDTYLTAQQALDLKLIDEII